MTSKEVTKLASELLQFIEQNNSKFNTNVLALINALCIILAAKHYEYRDDEKVDFDYGLKLIIETLETEVPRIFEEYKKLQDDIVELNELGSIPN